MKLPIRDQILWPLTGLLLAAVAANAMFSAWWTSHRSLQSLESRQKQIIGVLEESSFPLSTSVLEKLRRLTGDELVVWDSGEKRVVAGTLPISEIADVEAELTKETRTTTNSRWHTSDGQSYVTQSGQIRGVPFQTLFVLTSEETLRKISHEAIWPPLAVGFVTILLSIPMSLLLASSWSRRIRSVEKHVQSISQGDFGLEMKAGSINDEVSRLVASINSMSRQLRAMREQLIQGERTRLVAQLAAGFAHQLRNGLAGAKLAIQLHESRCTLTAESSLEVARTQLALVEQEVQGLLSLGRPDSHSPLQVDLGQIVKTVEKLVTLSCEHQGVELTVQSDFPVATMMGFADGLRAAILNLTLNAIDAAKSGGHVWLTLYAFDDQIGVVVEDDGSGPPDELSGTLFDSFVTTKAEGIGLGLTIAANVARTHHGSLTWCRANDRTQFKLTLPATAVTEKNDD